MLRCRDMRLSEFILHDMEAILAAWEKFARTLLPAAHGMTSLALRDHAQQILQAAAKDIQTPQTRAEQSEKSMGRAPALPDAAETAAQTHAVLRARGGFDVNQLVAEYRALRASVLRLWMDDGPIDETGLREMVRFNEAIDQAVAESVGHFHGQVEQARNLLLGMLGHDMRSPLQTILTTAAYLSAINAGEQVSKAADRLIRSGAAMQALLDDLTDFNRTRLGLGVKVTPAELELAAMAANELDQLRGAYPGRRIDFSVEGDARGRWDGARLQQLLRNLVSNALRHGAQDAPVRVALKCGDGDVCLEVSNWGPVLDPAVLENLFDPLRARAAGADDKSPSGLGLGLFIVREIARAHGGEVQFHTDDGKTTVSVRLPR